MKNRSLVHLAGVLAVLMALMVPAVPAGATAQTPILAKYYAWFDGNTWGSGKLTDQPAAPYTSHDRSTIERHVDQAKAAGVDGFQLNWWGPGNPTDSNLQTLLDVAKDRGFVVTVDFDMNSPFVRNAGEVTSTLAYLKRYQGHPAWFRYQGKPVVSFYGNRKYDVGAWRGVRAAVDPNNEQLWIAEGDVFGYLAVFDGIHPYSVAWSGNPSGQLASYASRTRAYPGKLWVATVMPGYNDTLLGRSNGFAVDRRGGAYYTSLWRGALATKPAFIAITSWNEWLEGSQIEPSTSYGDLYLRLTRQLVDEMQAGPAPAPAPAAPAASGAGAFYTEAGQGKGGFAITDAEGKAFWSSFRALGGVGALGYPASQRYERDGFSYQAMQGAVLQWRPEYGRAILANTFEWFTDAGKDDWLLETAGIPKPIRDDGSNGSWERAKQTRLGWLTDPGIARQYRSVGSLDRAIELYGLPMSKPERRGPFVVQRFQRIAFQHWVEAVPGMPAPGSVVRVLGGDLLKQAGLVPAAAMAPTSR